MSLIDNLVNDDCSAGRVVECHGMMRWLLMAALLTASPVSTVLPASDEDSCDSCHQDRKFFVQHRRLHDYYQNWLQSPHRAAGVRCHQCHGGDPTAAGKDAAHRGVRATSDAQSRTFYRNLPETCGECHAETSEHFVRSRHYAALMGEQDAPHCSTCHSAMLKRIPTTEIANNVCGRCHSGEVLTTVVLVPRRMGEILYRVSLMKTYLNWLKTHYEGQQWPLDSYQETKRLEAQYRSVVSAGHDFDIARYDSASAELLEVLKAEFQKAWDQEHSEQKAPTQ